MKQPPIEHGPVKFKPDGVVWVVISTITGTELGTVDKDGINPNGTFLVPGELDSIVWFIRQLRMCAV